MLERWVRQLLAAGVPASRITIVGFSKGSYITAFAADRLRETGIHTALLGSCSNGDVTTSGAPLVLGGDLLNIYETTDSVRECGVLAKRSHLTSFKEVAIPRDQERSSAKLMRSAEAGSARIVGRVQDRPARSDQNVHSALMRTPRPVRIEFGCSHGPPGVKLLL